MKHTYAQLSPVVLLLPGNSSRPKITISESPERIRQKPVPRSKASSVIDLAASMHMARQAEKFFDQQESSPEKAPAVSLPKLPRRLSQDSPSSEKINAILSPKHIRVRPKCESPMPMAPDPSRDVSYILDQEKRNTQGSGLRGSKKKDLYSTMGVFEDSSNTYPETVEELNKVRLTIRSRKTYRVFLKNDIFKEAAGLSSPEPLTSGKGFGIPSSRYDAIVLHKWFDSILSKLENEVEVPEDCRLELVQTAYYICYKELVRQISVHCVERGILLWKLWKGYLGLVESMHDTYELNKRRREKQHDETVRRIHGYYENELKEVIHKFKGEKEDMEKTIEKLWKENESMKKETEGLQKENKSLSEKLGLLRNVEWELSHYKRKYENLKDYNKKLMDELEDVKEALQSNFAIAKAKRREKKDQDMETIKWKVENEGIQVEISDSQSQETQTEIPKLSEKNLGVLTRVFLEKYKENGLQAKNDAQTTDEAFCGIERNKEQKKTDSEKLHEAMQAVALKVKSKRKVVPKEVENTVPDSQKSPVEDIKQFQIRIQELTNENEDFKLELSAQLREYEELSDQNQRLLFEIRSLKGKLAEISVSPKNERKSLPIGEQSPFQKTNASLNASPTALPLSHAVLPEMKPKRGCITQRNFENVNLQTVMQTPMGSFGGFCEFRFNVRQKQTRRVNRKIVDELKQIARQSKTQPVSLKSLLRSITYLYQVRVNYNKSISPQLDFANFVHAELTNRYGLKVVAEHKFLQIMAGCIEYKRVRRVKVFGKLMGIYEEGFTHDEFRVFLDILIFIQNWGQGYIIESKDTDETQYVPYKIALECTAHILSGKTLSADLNEKLEEIKTTDSKTREMGGVIELDFFIEHMLEHYKKIIQNISKDLQDLFNSVDFHLKGTLSFEEFEILLFVVEPQAYSKKTAKKLFNECAVNQESISLEKLASLSVRHGLFLPKTLEKVLGKSLGKEFDVEAQKVREGVEEMKLIFQKRMVKAGLYNAKWEKRLESVEKRTNSEDSTNKFVWTMWRVLWKYSYEKMKANELKRLFPESLADICAMGHDYYYS